MLTGNERSPADVIRRLQASRPDQYDRLVREAQARGSHPGFPPINPELEKPFGTSNCGMPDEEETDVSIA